MKNGNGSFAGKVAFVTGAGSGIGRVADDVKAALATTVETFGCIGHAMVVDGGQTT